MMVHRMATNKPQTKKTSVEIWDIDSVIEQYRFSHDYSPETAVRHLGLRQILQEHGYVPPAKVLVQLLQQRGVQASEKVVQRDLCTLGWNMEHNSENVIKDYSPSHLDK